jgi:hypothetical protein
MASFTELVNRGWVLVEGTVLAGVGGVALELLVAGPGVFEAPDAGEPVVGHVEEVDLVDVHRPARGWQAQPGSLVGAGAPEAGDDDVAFGDELDDVLVPVGERGAELMEGASQCAGEGGCGDLVEGVGVVGVDDVVDEAPDQGLGIGHDVRGSGAVAVVVVGWMARTAAGA